MEGWMDGVIDVRMDEWENLERSYCPNKYNNLLLYALYFSVLEQVCLHAMGKVESYQCSLKSEHNSVSNQITHDITDRINEKANKTFLSA